MFELHPQLNKDTFLIGKLPLCQVLLMNERQFPWLILVPQRSFIREIYELNESDQNTLNKESIAVSELLMKHFGGDKLNVAAIGNIVAQLHIHHIVRFEHDIAWPKPVWGHITVKTYTKIQKDRLIPTLQKVMTEKLSEFIAC